MKVKRLVPHAKLPVRGSEEAAGLDLFSIDEAILPPGVVVAIRTGLAIAIPKGYVGLIRDRSGWASKGITTQCARMSKGALAAWYAAMDEDVWQGYDHPLGGVIDSDYRGEWKVLLINTTNTPITIKPGDKIAQFLVLALGTEPEAVTIEECDSLTDTARGEKGFGSTDANSNT